MARLTLRNTKQGRRRWNPDAPHFRRALRERTHQVVVAFGQGGLSAGPTAARPPFRKADSVFVALNEGFHQRCCRVMIGIMGGSLYDPINVYKAVGPDIGIVDGPFEYLTMAGVRLPLPFTTRMTVVRLSNGDLFLHSPVRFDPDLADQIQRLGTVRHLISPNQFHYAHIGEWAHAFPSAVCWASPGVRKRARARRVDVRFDRDLQADPPHDWAREIDQTLVPGGYFKEFVFFHRSSRTLILTDTVLNLELDKTAQPWRTAAWLTGMHPPHGQIFFGMRMPLMLQRRKTAAMKETIRAWQPVRILLSHGRCFEENADPVVGRLF